MPAFLPKTLAILAVTAALAPGQAASADSAVKEGAVKEGAVMGVRAGMTLEAARASAPALSWVYEREFMVDFSALCAVKGDVETGETQFCALVPEAEKENASEKIEAIAVFGKSLKTAEGAHVGMTVAAAAQLYGAPTFSVHHENESRETLSFANAPKGLTFQASSDSDPNGYAGVYAASSKGESYRETAAYAGDAAIDTIWLN